LRKDIIEALGSFETDGAPAVPHLLGFLTNSDVEIVAGAASALGDIGEEANLVAPALAKLLSENPHETVRAAAAASLSQFGDKARPAIPILRTALDHPNKDVREAAASVLQALSGSDAATNATNAVQLRR
jgi:HEAT repeat protein